MNKFKGIILAGGAGTRLTPLTSIFSKHLLPVYDKPMIYYSLSVLMLAEIRDILIITTPNDLEYYKKLIGTGNSFGLNIEYATQSKPDGLAKAFVIGADFIGKDNVSLILGDNIFFGSGFSDKLLKAKSLLSGANIFSYAVTNPERFGVFEFNKNGKVKKIVEKPKRPKSNFIQTGLFFYDNKVVDYAMRLKKSTRGEYEITDLNNIYLKKKKLNLSILGRGFYWFDTGTFDSLLKAGESIKLIQEKTGFKISCPEEIAYKKRWINKNTLMKSIKKYPNCSYSEYLKNLI